jgi:hypothetical protein
VATEANGDQQVTDQPNMTLGEFLADVRRIQHARRAAGVATVYFRHRTFCPANVVEVWDDVPLADVPGPGDVIDMAGTGRMGAEGRWRVMRQEWMPGAAVTVYVADVDSEPGGSMDVSPLPRPLPESIPTHPLDAAPPPTHVRPM